MGGQSSETLVYWSKYEFRAPLQTTNGNRSIYLEQVLKSFF